MRGFFFLLLLSNVSFFAWQYINERTQSEPVDIYRGIAMVSNGLTLINELPEEERPPLIDGATEDEAEPDEKSSSDEATKQAVVEKAEEPPQAPQQEKSNDTPVTTVCYRIGHIETKSDLEGLISRLKRNGASNIEHTQHQVDEENYWVILPPYPNRKTANDAAEILNRKGIKDFFIVRTGQHQNAISLGVYSTRGRAMVRYNEVANLKARLRKPEIESLDVPVTRYVVSYKLNASAKANRVSAYLRRQKMNSAEEILCK